MAKSKIEVGQCYESNDHVYEIIERYSSAPASWWVKRHIITKEITYISENELLTWRRPFENFG